MVSKPTKLVQGGHQATILQDEMATMRQSHGISMKRLQVKTQTPQNDTSQLRCMRCMQYEATVCA